MPGIGKNCLSKHVKITHSGDIMTIERKLGESSESITFRLRADLLAGLRKECGREGVTLNAVMSQILGHFMSWNSTAAKAGFIPVPRHLLVLLLSEMPDEKVVQVAKVVARDQVQDILLLMRGKISEEAIADVMEAWIREADFAYSKSPSSLVIQHDMGARWSVFLATIIEELYYSAAHRRIRTDFTDNTVVLHVGA
jgi:hypothetical protein